VKGLVKNEKGKITGVELEDKINKKSLKVNGKIVVNATGCFADTIRKMDDPEALNKVVASGGSHIVLPKKYGS
jgi:glycerol-3-phosphate dehydrogenase